MSAASFLHGKEQVENHRYLWIRKRQIRKKADKGLCLQEDGMQE